MPNPEVSIVIPSFNSENTIRFSLECLSKQSCLELCEVIVIDCSESDVVDKICVGFKDVILVKRKQRFNPGQGRNIGAKIARGKWLVFIDADVLLGPFAIENILKTFREGCSVFGGALELSEHSPRTLASVGEHFFYNHESQAGRSRSIRSNLSSALLAVDKDVFMRFGGFSDIPRMQDAELTERMKKGGEVLCFIPVIIGYQIQNSPIKKVFKKTFINGNNLYFIRYQSRANFSKRLFFCVALPLLAILKATRINFRNILYNADKWKTILSLPFIYLLSFIWMAGFYNAVLTDRGLSRSR